MTHGLMESVIKYLHKYWRVVPLTLSAYYTILKHPVVSAITGCNKLLITSNSTDAHVQPTQTTSTLNSCVVRAKLEVQSYRVFADY